MTSYHRRGSPTFLEEEEEWEEEEELEPTPRKPRKRPFNKLVRMYYYYSDKKVKPILVIHKQLALKCPNCGYIWVPRVKNPKCCPSCSIQLEPPDPTNVEEKDEILEELAKYKEKCKKLEEEIARLRAQLHRQERGPFYLYRL